MKQTATASRTNGRKTKTSTSNKNQNAPSRNSRSEQNSTTRQQSRSSDTARPASGTRQRAASSGTASPSRTAPANFLGNGHYLEKFFIDQLQDIYYAEQKIVQSLPKMAGSATTEELREAFEDHLHQTQRHVKRLEKVFNVLGQKPEGKKCEAIEGIVREAEQIIKETEEDTMTRDAALIMAAQKVEHYEIATYGGLIQLAITMGLYEAADILDKTLLEEEDTDMLLTEIAECEINIQAELESMQSGEEEESTGESDTAGEGS